MPHVARALIIAFVLGIVAAPAAGAATQGSSTSEQTASQSYLDYRVAFEKATKVEELLPLMAASRRKQVESTPAAQRPEMFAMIKAFDTYKNVKILKETRSGATAMLMVEGTDDGVNSSGTITMVREGSAWKVDKESWKTSAP